MKDHVALCISGDGWTENGGIVGEAASEEEALSVVHALGWKYANYNYRYDAEDGPGVQGYEPDGRGVWIVAVLPNVAD